MRTNENLCGRCLAVGAIQNGRCRACGAAVVQRAENSGNLLPLGARLDNGSIIVGDKLGNGGFGVTYIAKEKDMGLIALKEFVPRHMVSGHRANGVVLQVHEDRREAFEKSLRSFQRESRVLSLLRHPKQ